MPVAVVVPRTTLQPETTGACLAPATLWIKKWSSFNRKAHDLYLWCYLFAAVPEWFAAGSFGLITVFTLLLRNVPALQSDLL